MNKPDLEGMLEFSYTEKFQEFYFLFVVIICSNVLSRIVAGSMLTSEPVNSANHGMFMTVRDINYTSSYGNMKENNNGNAKANKCYVFTHNHSSYSNTSKDEIIRVIHDSVQEFAKNRSIPIRMYLEGGTLIQSLRYGRIDPSAVDDIGMILRAPNPDGSRSKHISSGFDPH